MSPIPIDGHLSGVWQRPLRTSRYARRIRGAGTRRAGNRDHQSINFAFTVSTYATDARFNPSAALLT
jgi:hypothetical protein